MKEKSANKDNQKIRLLDCTLRDGAHVNKGYFGRDTIRSIVGSLLNAKIDFIELGFLQNVQYDSERSFFSNIDQCDELLSDININNTDIALMIRPDRFDINKLGDKKSVINSIRIAFYSEHTELALQYAEKLSNYGYKCYLNPINITEYSYNEVEDVVRRCNNANVRGVSIVDTLGALNKNSFNKIVSIFNKNLSDDVFLGIHLHENLSHSFGLVQGLLLDEGVNRDIIIDASLLGMGRNPGNLPTELIASYLNKSHGKEYLISEILKSIEIDISPIMKKIPWGYSVEYMLSAMNNVHRSYPEVFVEEYGLSLVECEHLIKQIIKDKKNSRFDANYAKKIANG